jgi:hypothetical protein
MDSEIHLLGAPQTAYWAYVGRCEAAGTGFCPWLADGVQELFALDPFLAYQHGFVYVRDMALAVHAALTATDNVCNQRCCRPYGLAAAQRRLLVHRNG